jgi:hypothetical protein
MRHPSRPSLLAFVLLLAGGGSLPAAVLPNPAITASATAYNASFVASNLFDGTAAEYASLGLAAGAAFSTTTGTWVQMDFGAPVTMDRLILVTRTNTVDVVGTSRLILSNDPTFDNTDAIYSFTPTGSNGQGLVKSFAPTTARYARWEVGTSTGSSPNLGGWEMRFLNTPAGSLIAPATAYASATPFSTNYIAANAVNGDAGRGNQAGVEYACAGLGTGMYVDFDLGSIVSVNGFDFFDRIPPVDRTTAFSMTFDDDSSTFATPVTVKNFSPGSTGWGYSQTFPPVSARYIRLHATAVFGANNNSGIQEIIFYKESNLNAPLVVNTAATGVTFSGATAGGNITRVGSDTPTVTLYYGTASGGTTAANWQNSVNLGPQTTTFSTNLTGLLASKTYYYIAFAQNSSGSNWADSVLSFTTPANPSAPVVVNTAASAVNFSSATVGGNVTNVGSDAPAITLYYGTVNGGLTPANWQNSLSLGAKSGPFSTNLSSLLPNKTYFFTCFAQNSSGPFWAEPVLDFTTLVGPPAIVNTGATEINATTARLGSNVTDAGGQAPTVVFYYGPSDGGTTAANWLHNVTVGPQTGASSTVIAGLSANATYYYRAFAANANGSVWAPSTASFTSATPVLPVVENRPATDINAFSASLAGKVTYYCL